MSWALWPVYIGLILICVLAAAVVLASVRVGAQSDRDIGITPDD